MWALHFTTDARLIGGDLVEPTDDRRLQPAENATPMVRHEVLDRRGPEFELLVNQVSGELTTTGLRQREAPVAVGIHVSRLVREWISSHDFRP
jgi:glycine betaine/choline ABC-type transport system substrate-binding protein